MHHQRQLILTSHAFTPPVAQRTDAICTGNNTARSGHAHTSSSDAQSARLGEDGGFDSAKVDIPLTSTGHKHGSAIGACRNVRSLSPIPRHAHSGSRSERRHSVRQSDSAGSTASRPAELTELAAPAAGRKRDDSGRAAAASVTAAPERLRAPHGVGGRPRVGGRRRPSRLLVVGVV